MKIIIPVSVLLVAMAVVVPMVTVDKPVNIAKAEIHGEAAKESPSETPLESPSVELVETNIDIETNINVLMSDGSVAEMNMLDYQIGVVAGEMPATFADEALKAQAVAARTYTLYKTLVSPSANHPQADVCTDHTCCKAYVSDEQMRANWGSEYETNIGKIRSAVSGTDGKIMVYENKPILAVFHSSSSGSTEASANVWGGEVAYLQSVQSFESESSVPNYYTAVEMTYDEFKSTFLSAHSEAQFGDDVNGWITDIQRSATGRINTITIGGVTIKGTALRTLYSLRSTAVEFSFGDNGITLTTKGYGHGVGMSQYGANYLANQGYDYNYILNWYYTCVEITTSDKLE